MGKHVRSNKGIKRRLRNRNRQNLKISAGSCVDDKMIHFFTQYRGAEVITALSVVQLWLPNISAIFKHHLAVAVFSAIPEVKFSGVKSIETYQDFSCFCEALFELLLSNPMLEDFVPETDWGEIKMPSANGTMKVFYGGSIERITDFIEAFKIANADNEKALNDVNFVLRLQNSVLSLIPSSFNHVPERIDCGHLETPSESFWSTCCGALQEISESIALGKLGNVSKGLVLELGQVDKLKSIDELGDKIMSGQANPAVALKIDDKYYPILLRDSVDAVICYWNRVNVFTKRKVNISSSISKYLYSSFPQVLSGPYFLFNDNMKVETPISTIIKSDSNIYFIILISRDQVGHINLLDSKINSVLSVGERWGIKNPRDDNPIMLCDAEGKCARADVVKRIYVLSEVSTNLGMLPLPRTSARVIPLPDFITITDSIENISELDAFWTFIDENENTIFPGIVGLVDNFAAFRSSHSVLVDGVFDGKVVLPPLLGGDWRYEELKKRWENAPDNFPDKYNRWSVASGYDGIICLQPKVLSKIAWSTKIANCTIHFVFDFALNDLDLHNGKLLEFLIEVFADALSQRRAMISSLAIFNYKQLTVNCLANGSNLARKNTFTDEINALSLYSWGKVEVHDEDIVFVDLILNIDQIQNEIYDAKDSSFQASFTSNFVQYINGKIGKTVDDNLINDIEESSSWRLRCALGTMKFDYEVPELFNLIEPEPVDYKLARKELAKIYNKLGVSPGEYEGSEAKSIISSARDEFRKLVHELILNYEVKSIVLLATLQCNIAYYKMDLVKKKAALSQTHVTNYDVAKEFADKKEEYTKIARNYRYLLEYSLSSKSHGKIEMLEGDARSIIGYIDWLLVLYEASDILHNDLEQCSISINHDYVPEVVYPPTSVYNGKSYSRELAQLEMGVGVTKSDLVESADAEFMQSIDVAFLSDLNFTFTNMIKAMSLLANWAATAGLDKDKIVYSDDKLEIVTILKGHFLDVCSDELHAIVDFLTLDPSKIRKLAGRDQVEADVPIWEHSKRLHRCSIRPLSSVGNGSLVWGVVSVYKACMIWIGNINKGCLPGSFDFEEINKIVRGYKERTEKRLESQAEKVVRRSTQYLEKGVDFHRRYPREGFADVGDYDVLSYWPDANIWLTIECKYNKAPFCLKDARRLRDYIYAAKKGHLAKIEKRRSFLEENIHYLRELLGWPVAVNQSRPEIYQLYVTADLMPFMRNMSPEVQTEFVRIDCLDSWLKDKGLLKEI